MTAKALNYNSIDGMSKTKVSLPLVVTGAGPAGCAAAIAAARLGREVLLIERYGFPGGMATTALVHPWMTYYAGDRPIIAGVFAEVVAALKTRGAYKDSEHFGNRHHCFDPEALKQVLLEMLQASGVKLLFHTFVTGVKTENRQICSLLLASKSGLEEIAPQLVIDASGDGDIAAWAGAPYEKGRPEDGLMQPMTLHFRMAGVDWGKVPSREEMNRLYVAAKASGEIDCPRENLLWFDTTLPDQIHFNTTRVTQVDGTSKEDLTFAEIESRRQAKQIVAFLQKRVPGFKQAYLSQTGAQIGVRETRRIMGEYVLTGEDVLAGRKFPDGIALSSYPIDVHNPEGEGTVLKYLPPGEFYAIPYRCLVPQKIDNLLVAGRPISTTHEAHASTRVQVVCYATGQAAGAAAALAGKNNLAPRAVPAAEIQSALRKQGAILE
jgi:hypothetical protein